MRKALASLLALCMILSVLSGSAFAATEDDVAAYGSYTSLGDSAVAGYGLQSWEDMKKTYAVYGWDALLLDAKDAIESLNALAEKEADKLVPGTEAYTNTQTMLAIAKYQEMTEAGENVAEHWHATDFTRRHRVENSYAAILADAVGASEDLSDETAGTFHHYAQCAFRTEELRMVLDKNYKGDSEELVNIAASMSNGSFTYNNLIELQENEEYVDAIKRSNLITMSIGANDIYVPVLGVVMTDLVKLILEKAAEEAANKTEEEAQEEAVDLISGDPTDEELAEAIDVSDPAAVTSEEATEEDIAEGAEGVADAINTNDEASTIQTLVTLIALLTADDPTYIGKLLKLALQCELNYRINYGIIVERIFEINPNVTLVAPLYTLNYEGFGDLGNILKLVFGEMNLFVAARSNYNGHFIPVSLPDSELTFVDVSHPDEAGHALIARTLLKALPTADAVKGTTVRQGADNQWYAYTDGVYDPTVNSVVNNRFGWWKVENGTVNFKFNGIATNENGAWYLTGGKVNFLKTGYVRVDENGKQVLFGGTRYKVVGGHVQNYKS